MPNISTGLKFALCSRIITVLDLPSDDGAKGPMIKGANISQYIVFSVVLCLILVGLPGGLSSMCILYRFDSYWRGEHCSDEMSDDQ